VREPLLNRGDAAGILAVEDIGDLLGELEVFFCHDFTVFDDVDGDVVVDDCQHVHV